MSGGHFNNVQCRMFTALEDIDNFIAEEGHLYSEDDLAKFRLCRETVEIAAKMLQRVDWYASGDDGQDSFHQRWAEDGLP